MKTKEPKHLLMEELFYDSVKEKKISECKLINIEKLSGDASTREYFRVTTNKNPYIICLDDPTSPNLSFIKVQNVLSANNVRVPKIFDALPDKGYLLQEDLGDKTLLTILANIQSVAEELSIYKKCINQLLGIHIINVQKYSQDHFVHLAFDKEKLMSEVDHTIKHFINSFLNSPLSDDQLSSVQSTFEEICSDIADQKRILTHRDYHSRNIMVTDSNEHVIIDFQDARMGIPQYDLVSILEDCYYKIDTTNKQALIKHYWENLKDNTSFNSDYDEFLYYYDIMAIQRIFKAIGTFAYMFSVKNDIKYLKYIGHSFETLKEKLLKFKKFNKLRTIFSSVYYANS